MAIRKKDIKLAVIRNRIKRKIKGSFRANFLELQKKIMLFWLKKLSDEEKELDADLDLLWNKFKNKQ